VAARRRRKLDLLVAQDRIDALAAHVSDCDLALDDEILTPRDRATLLAERRKAIESLHRIQREVDEDALREREIAAAEAVTGRAEADAQIIPPMARDAH
jgi:hypothetical protein